MRRIRFVQSCLWHHNIICLICSNNSHSLTRSCSSWGYFIEIWRLPTHKLFTKVTRLKNWRSTFENVMIDLKNYNNIIILPSQFVVWTSPLLKCGAYTWYDHTVYGLLHVGYSERYKFTLPGNLFSPSFLSSAVVSVTFI